MRTLTKELYLSGVKFKDKTRQQVYQRRATVVKPIHFLHYGTGEFDYFIEDDVSLYDVKVKTWVGGIEVKARVHFRHCETLE